MKITTEFNFLCFYSIETGHTMYVGKGYFWEHPAYRGSLGTPL
jgi:hypothetical protein